MNYLSEAKKKTKMKWIKGGSWHGHKNKENDRSKKWVRVNCKTTTDMTWAKTVKKTTGQQQQQLTAIQLQQQTTIQQQQQQLQQHQLQQQQ